MDPLVTESLISFIVTSPLFKNKFSQKMKTMAVENKKRKQKQ